MTNIARPIAFWIALFAAVLGVVVLLREILLPFVAALVLAYLLDPLATRLERAGMNRLVATLAIMVFFLGGVAALVILIAPGLIGQLVYLSTISRFTSGSCKSLRATRTIRGQPRFSERD